MTEENRDPDIQEIEESDPILRRVRDWARSSPWWAISVGLHLIVFLVAALIYLPQLISLDEGVFEVDFRPPPQEKVQEIEKSTEKKEDAPEEDPSKAAEVADASQDESGGDEDTGSGDASDLFAAGDSSRGRETVTGVIDSSVTGGRPVGYGSRKAARVKSAAQKKEERPATEEAVAGALRWLARHQNPDGSWSVTAFAKNCGRHGYREDCSQNPFQGNDQFDVGVTGLALLAFLGAGHLSSSREPILAENQELSELSRVLGGEQGLTYGEVVKRAIKYLVRSQNSSSGMLGPEVDRSIYNHLIGALALCEAYGMTGVAMLREPAERAVEYVVTSRSPGKGWRYTYQSPDSDSSVTGWAVMVLKSAETSGLAYDRALHDEVRKWFDSITVRAATDPKLLPEGAPADKRLLTGYLGAEDAGKLVSVPGVNDHYHYTPALTAIMIMSTIMMDERLSARAAEGLETLMAFTPAVWNPREQKSWKLVDYYYWYYGTYALYQATPDAADPRWKRWNEAMKAALLDTQNLKDSAGQCREGSWDPVDRWSSEGGRVYSTAMAALTLEVYYRYPRVLALKKPEKAIKVDVR